MNGTGSPRLARMLLRLVREDVREFIAGDLEEERAAIEETAGRAAAQRWYWRQAVAAAITNIEGARRADPAARAQGDGVMRTVMQDVRYGLRMIRKNPAFSLVLVLTLALGIGANTVIFSFTNALLVRPLPIKDQNTLGWIFSADPQRGGQRGASSIPDYLDFRQSLRSFSSLAATSQMTMTMTGRGDATRLVANCATANLFDIWGVPAVVGRAFVEGDDKPGAGHVVVLSHRLWQEQFGSDRTIVGQSLTLNGKPYDVVGVLSRSIEIGNLTQVDIWVPLTLDPSAPRDQRIHRINGRLAPGATLEQASAEIREVSRRLERDHPDTNRGWIAHVGSTRESTASGDTWVILALLSTVVGFVLLIACANVANLVLVRATERRRELAVRTALGASRLRVVQQLLVESLMIGIAGGIAGLALASGGLQVIKSAAYDPFFAYIDIDRNVLIFTAALALMTPLIFSLLPAIQASKTDVNETLKDGGARAGGVRGRRSRSVLIVSQLALAMALLIVSGLLLRTMIELTRTPLGFDPKGVLSLQLEVPDWRYTTEASVQTYYERLLARIAALPGVREAASIERLPVLGGEQVVTLDIEGHTPAAKEERPWAVNAAAGHTFFTTARIPLLAGRNFGPQDTSESQRVVIVDQPFARRYWGEPNRAVGHHVAIAADGERQWLEIVGVVAGVKDPDLTAENPHIYRSAVQTPKRSMTLMVRAVNPDALKAAVRNEVRAIDVDVAVYQLRTIEEVANEELSSTRVLTGMFAAFALLALVLAGSGLYAVISYSVSQRVQEIGVRIALGAVARDIRSLIVRQTFALVVAGSAIGLAGGAAIARAATSVLYGVSPLDPTTYFSVAGLLAIVAVFSTTVPVRRATRIDPVTALRS